MAFDRQTDQKRSNLRRAHPLGMPFAMKNNVAPNPCEISLFRTDTVMPHADSIAHPLQEEERSSVHVVVHSGLGFYPVYADGRSVQARYTGSGPVLAKAHVELRTC